MSCAKDAPKPCTATPSAMSVVYDRNVHTVATHAPLKRTIPLEGCSAFGGKGLDLNPIDLVAMGLGSCLMIVMGKTAEAEKLDIVGARADVSYDLVNYRIATLKVTLKLPKKLSAADQAKLETASKKCPVFLAIHPDVKVSVEYIWPK
jgi:putative redox protein